MLELFLALGVCALVGLVLLGLLKLLVALLVLPFKIVFFLAKGVLGLLLLVPAVILVIFILTNALPVILFLLILPFVFFVAVLGLLLRAIF